ncbi:MAG: rubrerythrin [Desulfobacteraceae bacterium]|jgi:rubrerythrin|nr:MAG: rubrerythrin [Desulfobacteraceae bacterium]
MAYDFTAKEIFEMAKQIERNGVAFYQKAAKSVSDASEKDMLLELAKMEEDHEATFIKMEAQLKGQETAPTVFDPEDESVQYLKSLADTRVFFEKEIDLSSMKSILKAAITAEKDSIVFYLGMKELVPETLGKDRIDGIIKEEMSHIRLLGKKLVTVR